MILKAFSKQLQSYSADVPPTIVLARWLREILLRKPQNNVEKIIHTELTLLQDINGIYSVVGTNKNGQRLLDILCRFAESYDNQTFSRWLHEKQATDFKEKAEDE